MNTSNRVSRFFTSLLFISLIISISQFTYAATKTWDGEAGDGLWSTAVNWSGDTLPTNLNEVIIDDRFVADPVVHLDINFTLGVAGDLTQASSLRVGNGESSILPIVETQGKIISQYPTF